MLLYGAGGHARVIMRCIAANGGHVKAVFDDDPNLSEFAGLKTLKDYDPDLFKTESIVLAIGNNQLRRFISQKIEHPFATIIHPSALIDPDVSILAGSAIFHSAIIQTGSVIGKHVIINTVVSINHDCHIADFVHLAPGVILCGNVQIGENTFVGAGSIITPNMTIGRNCFIAAGSVVTKPIPDGCTVRGNPARIIRSRP